MAANQTEIPVIHHEDKNIVQIQQNVNKVLRNINNQTVSNQSASQSFMDQSTIVGEVKSAMLSETQFQAQTGTNWVLSDGRDVSGSQYQNITGSKTVPDLRGIFLRGKNGTRSTSTGNPDGDLALGTYTADKIILHTHTSVVYGHNANTGAGGTNMNDALSSNTQTTSNMSPAGANETAPRDVTVNFFIRIN